MSPDPSDHDRKSALRDQIDENLRRVYKVALEDEVPERFKLLLKQLRDAAETEKPSTDGQMQADADLPRSAPPQASAETGT